MKFSIVFLIILAGIGQIFLAIGSTAIPKILGWKQELQKVNPLVRHIFWTYAGYILVTNFSFGLISAFAPESLINGNTLSTAVSGYMFLYWLSRITIQFFGFDRKNFPTGICHKIGEVLLVSLFVYLTIVYGYAFYYNLIN